MAIRLIHLIGSSRWGGPERYACDICRHFSSLGWSVTAYTPDARIVDDNLSRLGVHLRTAPLRGGFDLDTVKILGADLKKEAGPIVIHTHRYRDALTALLARRVAGRPDIRIVASRHRAKRGIASPLHSYIYRNASVLLFPSQAALSRFGSSRRLRRRALRGVRTEVLLPSVLDAPWEPLLFPEKGPVTLLFHGPVIPGKGLETLIDALHVAKGCRARLCIAGNGNPEYVDRLRQRAQLRGVMELIDWHRFTPDPFSLIARAHIAVSPSTAPEACSLANLESMAAGRPVITTDNGAQPEYIADGREGFLVKPGDASALGEAIRRLASDSALREEMGAAARRRFEASLAWPRFAEALENIYHSACL